MLQNALSRVWFLNQGCKQVPTDAVDGKILWAHPDGYFLNAQGRKLLDNFSPAMQRGFTATNRTSGGSHGSCYPIMRFFGHGLCHRLMALAFYGDRPMDPTTGKPCVCHHLIPDKLDYRPANLLCWLEKAEHSEADRRQSALKKVLPDMHAISYEKHRFLQDPRTTCREVFDVELQKLRQQYGTENNL